MGIIGLALLMPERKGSIMPHKIRYHIKGIPSHGLNLVAPSNPEFDKYSMPRLVEMRISRRISTRSGRFPSSLRILATSMS
jgi:hypothetical protein